MYRVAFRALLAFTLIVLVLGRMNGGKFPPLFFVVFDYWFLATIVVFTAFGAWSAYLAWQQPQNRRAYTLDVMLAAAWIPLWYVNLKP
jgi:hypothetical protein